VSDLTSDSPQGVPPFLEVSEPQAAPGPRPSRPLLHIALFAATLLTTTAAGAFQAGVNLFEYPWRIYEGWPFALSILAILTAHEMGHYLVSRRHGLDVTLPFFLPGLPFPPPLPGTFGALIRIRSPILDKRALLDVGCSGPLIGLVVIVPVLVIGLLLSPVKELPLHAHGSIELGEPLLFRLVSLLTLGPLGPEQHVLLHPVGFAGWLGLLITALNLLPVGQLDGGHVMYALFPGWHRRISLICVGALVVFGVFTWQGWLLWAVLLIALGTRHPPPYYDWIPLDRRRWVLGVLTIVVFLLTFTPMPFNLG
jgi:membrane-associated protease RseP (regulator of RpoE activity)